MSSMRTGWVAAGVLAGVLAYGTAAQAAVPSGNLIVNGDAETGVGATDSSTVSPVPIPGWTTTANFTEYAYQDTREFPTPSDSALIRGGGQFFAGGPDATGPNATESATQDVDVSGAAPEIDAGGVTATLAAALGGFETQEDGATVTAAFLAADGRRLAELTIGPVSEPDRGGATKLLARTASKAVPEGTRTIHVVIVATRTEGTYDDGYVDNVALSLTGGGTSPGSSAVKGPKGNPLGLPTRHRCVPSRRFTVRVHHTRRARIVAAKAYVNGKRRASKRGRSITRLTLKRLPHKRFTLRVEATESTGLRLVSQRTYHGCRGH
jgi:hypothetical protein